MAEYDFVLTFTLPDAAADPQKHLDALYEAGCDDATVGVGKQGSIALDFTRAAASAEEAVRSAIADVKKAIPGVSLLEVKPDFVNLSDVADVMGCSRQNVRKYAAGEIVAVPARFPYPAISGTTELWHLCEVVSWFAKHTDLRPRAEIVETSLVASVVNLEAQRDRIAQTSHELQG